MPKFYVSGSFRGYVDYVIEAETREAAEDEFFKRVYAGDVTGGDIEDADLIESYEDTTIA